MPLPKFLKTAPPVSLLLALAAMVISISNIVVVHQNHQIFRANLEAQRQARRATWDTYNPSMSLPRACEWCNKDVVHTHSYSDVKQLKDQQKLDDVIYFFKSHPSLSLDDIHKVNRHLNDVDPKLANTLLDKYGVPSYITITGKTL